MNTAPKRDCGPLEDGRQAVPATSAQQLPLWLCIAAVIVVLGVALALMWFAQPMADDFARGYDGLPPIIPSTIYEYHAWTGRWSAVAVNYVLTSFDLTRVYPLLLLANCSVAALAALAIVSAAGLGSNLRQRVALAGAALAIYWAGLPHPGESVYWLTGNTDNLLGPSVAVLLLAALLRHRPRRSPLGIATGAGLALLAIVAAGFHEVYALMLCLALLGGTLCMCMGQDSRRWTWGACLIAAIVGFLIVYLAPGNEQRRSHFPQAGSLATTLGLAARHGVPTVAAWVFDVRLLSATAILLMLQSMRASVRDKPAGGRTTMLIVAVTGTVTVAAALLAGYWAIGIQLPGRTLGGIYMAFLVGWFAVVVTAFKYLSPVEVSLLVPGPLLGRVLAVLFASAMLLTGSTWIGLLDLPRSAPTFRSQMQDRWAQLRGTASLGEEADVEVPRVWVRPKIFISAEYFELREDPQHWENFSVARYFHLRTVRLAPAPSPSRERLPGRGW